jgi:hypothetical protein
MDPIPRRAQALHIRFSDVLRSAQAGAFRSGRPPVSRGEQLLRRRERDRARRSTAADSTHLLEAPPSEKVRRE